MDTSTPPIDLLIKAAPSLFGYLADEKMLGGNLAQDDIFRIIAHQAVGDIVFEEEKQVFVCAQGIKAALLLTTPINLFDDAKPNMPQSSFVTKDRIFISKTDFGHYLLQGEAHCHAWLQEGALARAYLFAKTYKKDAQECMSHQAPSWQEGKVDDFFKAFPNKEKDTMVRHLTIHPATVLKRLQDVTSSHPSPLSRVIEEVTVPQHDDLETEASTEQAWAELLSASFIQNVRQLFEEGFTQNEVPQGLGLKISSWTEIWQYFHPAEAQAYFSKISRLIPSQMDTYLKGHEDGRQHFRQQCASLYASSPISTAVVQNYFISVLSGSYGFVSHKDETSRFLSFSNLLNIYTLAEGDPSLKGDLLKAVSMSSLLKALESVTEAKDISGQLLFGEELRNSQELDQALSLLNKQANIKDRDEFLLLSKWSISSLLENREDFLSLFEENADTNTHPLPPVLQNHKYHDQSHKSMRDLVLMCFESQSLQNNPEKMSELILKVVGIVTSLTPQETTQSQKAVMDTLAQFLPFALEHAQKKEKKCWIMVQKLASSNLAFPDFQKELTTFMIKNDMFEINTRHKEKWDNLMEIISQHDQDSEVRLSFKQSLDLAQHKELTGYLQEKLLNKREATTDTPPRKAKM